ncbi:heat shock protein 70 family protein [Tanacetum coccineum]
MINAFGFLDCIENDIICVIQLLSAYQSFATDTEKDGITKSLQEIEDWLYDDDESDERVYTGKLDDLKKLLEPIEKRYKDERARAKADKDLPTLNSFSL